MEIVTGLRIVCISEVALVAVLAASCRSATDPDLQGNRPPASVVSLQAGFTATCSLLGNASLYCWGTSIGGDLSTRDLVPRSVATNLTITSFALAKGIFGGSICASELPADVYCWGYWLGIDVGRQYGSAPTLLQDTLALSGLTAGPGHTCGLDSPGAAYCWGSNIAGKRGQGIPLPDSIGGTELNRVVGGTLYRAIGAGEWHSCALTISNNVHCWGFGPLLGDSSAAIDTSIVNCIWPGAPCSWSPVPVRSLAGIATLTVGERHTCALAQIGTLTCWGANESGQLGIGDHIDRPEPTRVQLPEPVMNVSAGSRHTCVLANTGSAYCWGLPGPWLGHSGPGLVPEPLESSLRFTALDAGYLHTCGIATDGLVYCWGQNDQGQLGNGIQTDSQAPVQVQFLDS